MKIRSFNLKKYLIISLVLFVGIFSIFYKIGVASVRVNLNVIGCNYNNICEPPDEANLNCSNDCTSCNYNDVCELLKGETPDSCPLDCRVAGGPIDGTPSKPVLVTGTILNINIKVGINYAIISWDSAVPTFGSVSWGKGDNFNNGVIKSLKISTHHSIIIENLAPNTKYSYSINSSLPDYYYAVSFGTFTTLPLPEIKFVPSIYDLTATGNNDEIILNWKNPISDIFSGVKIVRSPFFYPASPNEGKLIYDGSGNYARDTGVEKNTKYYYSAFSYDKDFNYSSGVVVEGSLLYKGIVEKEDLDAQNLSLNNFVFLEGDLELPVSSSTVRIYPFNDLKIIVGASRFSVDIKTLILRIQDPEDTSKIYSYSLILDPTGRYFYAVIPNFWDKNVYPFSIISYGLDNKEVSISRGYFDVKSPARTKSYSINYLWFICLIVIILIILSYLFFTKRNRVNQVKTA